MNEFAIVWKKASKNDRVLMVVLVVLLLGTCLAMILEIAFL
jgi:uncharacterized membrane protein